MQADFSGYTSYKAIDFFQDEDFFEYVHQPDRAISSVFWMELGDEYPHLRLEMEIARDWIVLFRCQHIHKADTPEEVLWSRIQHQIPVYTNRQMRIVKIRRLVSLVTSVAALWLVIWLFIEIREFGIKDIEVDYGLRKTVELPDESVIALNSNSKLRYKRNWKSDRPREVWLRGEALFDIKHTALRNRVFEKDYFIVRVSDLKLTVLGTRFNVKERRGKVDISLLEGRLQVEQTNGEIHFLSPGESFSYDVNRKELGKVKKSSAASVSWTDNELKLEHTALADIVEILEDNYGFSVELRDSGLLQQRLMGTIPARSAQDILFVIRHTMNLRIDQHNKRLIIDHLN